VAESPLAKSGMMRAREARDIMHERDETRETTRDDTRETRRHERDETRPGTRRHCHEKDWIHETFKILETWNETLLSPLHDAPCSLRSQILGESERSKRLCLHSNSLRWSNSCVQTFALLMRWPTHLSISVSSNGARSPSV